VINWIPATRWLVGAGLVLCMTAAVYIKGRTDGSARWEESYNNLKTQNAAMQAANAEVKRQRDQSVVLAEKTLQDQRKTLEAANELQTKLDQAERALVRERNVSIARLRDAATAVRSATKADLAATERSIQTANSWRESALSCERLAGQGASVLVDTLNAFTAEQESRQEAARATLAARKEYTQLEEAVIYSGCAERSNQ
jgi:hypothetical protein